MDDSRRFLDLLPFYVNGTLSGSDLVWLRDYLQRNPNLAAQVRFQEGVSDTLKQTVAESIAAVPADLGFNDVMSRIRADSPVKQPERAMLTRFVAWFLGSGVDTWRFAPALALALLVIGVQGVLLFESVFLFKSKAPAYSEVRSSARSLADGPLLRVNFKPEARESDIRLKLIEVRALIVAGPTRLGDYYLKAAPERLAVVRQALNQSGLTQGIDEVPGLPEEMLE